MKERVILSTLCSGVGQLPGSRTDLSQLGAPTGFSVGRSLRSHLHLSPSYYFPPKILCSGVSSSGASNRPHCPEARTSIFWQLQRLKRILSYLWEEMHSQRPHLLVPVLSGAAKIKSTASSKCENCIYKFLYLKIHRTFYASVNMCHMGYHHEVSKGMGNYF